MVVALGKALCFGSVALGKALCFGSVALGKALCFGSVAFAHTALVFAEPSLLAGADILVECSVVVAGVASTWVLADTQVECSVVVAGVASTWALADTWAAVVVHTFPPLVASLGVGPLGERVALGWSREFVAASSA